MYSEEEQPREQAIGMEDMPAQRNRYVFRANISNPDRPDLGYIIVCFPFSDSEYDRNLARFVELGIGDPLKRDCCIGTVDSHYQYLKRLQNHTATLDELNYLAKRLESFCVGEDAQFQAMAYKLELTDIKDLINLTFCCQTATVITDFTELTQTARQHYMNINGGAASTEELDKLDAVETFYQLIGSGAGTITPYGVVYQNAMELEPLYNGRQFPAYVYERSAMMLSVTPKHGLDEGHNPEYIYLPATKNEIERTLIRAGVQDYSDIQLALEFSELPKEVTEALDLDNISGDDIASFNQLCYAVKMLNSEGIKKLNAAVAATHTSGCASICRLIKNFELFDFYPDVRTVEDYGEYMIRRSGHFAYDENLDDYYDFKAYGEQRVKKESGVFTAYGYIVYSGWQSLDVLLQTPLDTQTGSGPGLLLGGI